MRTPHFVYLTGEESPSYRHRARSVNFNDQSIFTYAHSNKNWWGYA